MYLFGRVGSVELARMLPNQLRGRGVYVAALRWRVANTVS
jgi:hypothetical protein